MSIRHEMVVLMECNMIFNGGTLVRPQRAPRAEEPVETAVFIRGAFRADLSGIEGKVISFNQHVLSLPSAVVIVGIGSDKTELGALAEGRHGGIDQCAITGGGVPRTAAIPIGVLVEHDTTPIVDERVASDREGSSV